MQLPALEFSQNGNSHTEQYLVTCTGSGDREVMLFDSRAFHFLHDCWLRANRSKHITHCIMRMLPKLSLNTRLFNSDVPWP